MGKISQDIQFQVAHRILFHDEKRSLGILQNSVRAQTPSTNVLTKIRDMIVHYFLLDVYKYIYCEHYLTNQWDSVLDIERKILTEKTHKFIPSVGG